MAAYEVLLLNTTLPQIQAAQAGDTYVVPRDITFSTNATFTTGTANGVMYLNGDKIVSTGSLLTFNGTTFTAPSLSLTNALSTTSGGTGLSSYTAGDLTYYSTGTALSKLAIGTANQVLTSSGTAPQWTSLSSIGVTSVSFGSTGLTPSSATAGAVSVGGTLVTSNGGTGLSSYTAGDLVYYSTGTALSKLAIGTASQILTSSGSAPQWSTASGISVGTATNLAGGAAGSVPYQSGAGATTFLSIGAANRVLTSTGSAPQWVTSLTGLTGVSSSSITNTALTSGRVVYSTTGGAQTDSASLTFDGTTFSTTTVDTTNLEVTNIKAKDGTTAASIADSTGVISITSNPILSGGTANGVLYLNGSKVATSGSALTFDGTNFVNTAGYLGTTQSGATSSYFIAKNSIATSGVVFGAHSSGAGYIDVINNNPLFFAVNDTEQMRLTSTGLGIGTSNPATRLSVDNTRSDTAGTGWFTYTNAAVTSGKRGMRVDTNNGYWFDYYNGSTWSAQMGLDSSGNLRLGTTSSLSAADRLTVVGGNIAVQRTSGITTFMGDNTQDGYVGTVTNHAFAFLTNSTERMRIDSSGNLGIGTSSPSYKLEVVAPSGDNITALFRSGDATAANNAGGGFRSISSATATSRLAQVWLDADGANFSGGDYFYIQKNGNSGTVDIVQYSNSAMTFATNATERMRLDSSGKLLINATTSPSAATVKVAIQGASGSDSYYQFGNGSGGGGLIGSVVSGGIQMYTYTGAFGSETYTERARITSGGDLLVGTTTAGAGIGFDVKLAVDAGSGETSVFKTSTTSAYPQRVWNSATTGDNNFVLFLTEAGGTGRGSINYNRAGGLVAYNTTSDYRAKDIIGPVANPGATIDALKVYEGKMKGATQSRPMLVAHEAQDHAPYAVTGEKDAVNEDGTPKYQQMDVSSLVPLLLAEIQSLRARVAQLESKGV